MLTISDLAIVGLASTLLLTLLFSLISRSLQRAFLHEWTRAWRCAAMSMAALLLGLVWPGGAHCCQSLHLFLQYSFALQVIAGCAAVANRPIRPPLLAYIVMMCVAVVLPAFNEYSRTLVLIPHSLVMFCLVFAARALLIGAKIGAVRTEGLGVLASALLILSGNFALSGLLFSLPFGSHLHWLHYPALHEFLLLFLLGFGMIMVAMEWMRLELEAKNHALREAGDRLERLATSDAMTTALNRHAFYGLFSKPGHWHGTHVGSVALIDIDHLKPINDHFGHIAGDAAIRATAKAIRALIRPDDLLFRWGGDEFLLLLPGLPAPEARKRLTRLNDMLQEVDLPGLSKPIRVGASVGVAPFENIDTLEHAIHQADSAMYVNKQQRRETAPMTFSESIARLEETA